LSRYVVVLQSDRFLIKPSDGLDNDAARLEAETELWESTLPALS
jgi:hypothetical protein